MALRYLQVYVQEVWTWKQTASRPLPRALWVRPKAEKDTAVPAEVCVFTVNHVPHAHFPRARSMSGAAQCGLFILSASDRGSEVPQGC